MHGQCLKICRRILATVCILIMKTRKKTDHRNVLQLTGLVRKTVFLLFFLFFPILTYKFIYTGFTNTITALLTLLSKHLCAKIHVSHAYIKLFFLPWTACKSRSSVTKNLQRSERLASDMYHSVKAHDTVFSVIYTSAHTGSPLSDLYANFENRYLVSTEIDKR